MQFAKFLELLFFPSNVVLFVFLIFFYNYFASMSIFDMLVYSIAVIGFPTGYIIMNKRSRRKNRAGLLGLLITLLIFSGLSLIFGSLRSPRFLFLATYSFLALGLITFSIRFKWKISFHVSTFTASVTILTIFNQNFSFLYAFIPLLAWSRIKLKIHTFYQTLAGFVVGLIIPIIVFL